MRAHPQIKCRCEGGEWPDWCDSCKAKSIKKDFEEDRKRGCFGPTKESLEAENARLQRDHDLMLANLTATQARCTELLEENRRLKAALSPRVGKPGMRLL